ncbi:MAG: GspH/FimT family pseudopilin [Clostridiales bacterium]|nr:GspH/FimT family pseudopilin [Clostridiales bacterium]
MRKNLQKISGFTLIELMIAIGIISIMTAIAVPAVMNWLPNYRLKAAARDLYSNMQKAKLEAVKRNTNVIIIFTTGAYVPAGRVGSYQVFVDDGGTNADPGIAYNKVRDGDEHIITTIVMPKNVSLYNNNFSNNTAGYNSRGLPCTALGRVRFQNNNSRYYQASLSTAGNVKLRMSKDGTTWN